MSSANCCGSISTPRGLSIHLMSDPLSVLSLARTTARMSQGMGRASGHPQDGMRLARQPSCISRCGPHQSEVLGTPSPASAAPGAPFGGVLGLRARGLPQGPRPSGLPLVLRCPDARARPVGAGVASAWGGRRAARTAGAGQRCHVQCSEQRGEAAGASLLAWVADAPSTSSDIPSTDGAGAGVE